MPDRSLRLPSLLLRERSSSPTPPRESEGTPEQSGQPGRDQGSGPSDDNPFAPPPDGAPDRPWQPRRPEGGQGADDRDGRGGGLAPWGRWSDRQPGRSSGGPFGERPGGPGGSGQGPEGGPGSGLRWDPTDPVQRHARYSLLCGMWAFFFALFSWPYVALLLGSLAVYWAVGALRAKPRTPDPAQSATPEPSGRPQKTAAISGLVTSTLALTIVAGTFTAQFVYRDYYTCVNDSLTTASEKSCKELLPEGFVRELLASS
ncbi:hypothetical protein WBG99_12895 [Streptomyces sp. TG1A-60]|uniref:hypothetical protein n=1 Tax=Streptomyces sp. TG1A-60 TaxID=3129111 RepID=UPI0030CDC8F0